MKKTLLFASVIALSSLGFAAQAATCGEMFNKAEKMLMEKSTASVDKKVKGYQMAVDSYGMCTQAAAMPDGAKKTAMMKDAEDSFEKVFSFALYRD